MDARADGPHRHAESLDYPLSTDLCGETHRVLGETETETVQTSSGELAGSQQGARGLRRRTQAQQAEASTTAPDFSEEEIKHLSMYNRGQGVTANRWKLNVDSIADDYPSHETYSKDKKIAGYRSYLYRTFLHIRRNRALMLAGAVLGGIFLLLLVTSHKTSRPHERRLSDHESGGVASQVMSKDQHIQLQEALELARKDLSHVQTRLHAAEIDTAAKKALFKHAEDEHKAAKDDQAKATASVERRIQLMMKKDSRIASATHKTGHVTESSTTMAAKKSLEADKARFKSDIQAKKSSAEKAKREYTEAQRIKSVVSSQVSAAKARILELHQQLYREEGSQDDMPQSQPRSAADREGHQEEEQAMLGEGAEPGDNTQADPEDGTGADDAGAHGASGEMFVSMEGLESLQNAEAEEGDGGEDVAAGEEGAAAEEDEPQNNKLKKIGELFGEQKKGEADADDGTGDGLEHLDGGEQHFDEGDEGAEAGADAVKEGMEEDTAGEAEGKADNTHADLDDPQDGGDQEAPATPRPTKKAGRRMGAGPLPAADQMQKPIPHTYSLVLDDDSIRCRTCRICEGPEACKASSDKTLACITDNTARRDRVKDAAKWSWKGYKESAWGKDEAHPLSRTHGSWFDLGLTLVDSLDTLWLMGLEEEFAEAREWVASSLSLTQNKDVNLFETTIRVLGGLLSAYNLTGDDLFLDKASDLGHRLLPAFRTQSGVPFSDVNLGAGTAHGPKWGSDSSTSEVTTLYLEFSYLSRLTGDPVFREKASHVLEVVDKAPRRIQGLAPIMINPDSGAFRANAMITFGARGDSYYEYLLKCWVISGRQDDRCLRMYKETMRGMRNLLIDLTSDVNGLTYIAELKNSITKEPKMDHLVCFMPGLLALGHWHGVDTSDGKGPSDLELATELMHTCYEMYRETPTGLAPEIVHFIKHSADYPKQHRDDVGAGHFQIKQLDAHNLLRPETVESLYIMWKVTKDSLYREWAWLIFRAFEMHARVPTGGYASLDSVLKVPPKKRDKMESFWIAETLKYLYLIFVEDDPLPLGSYVINTEAHPLPIDLPDAKQSGQPRVYPVDGAASAVKRRRLSAKDPKVWKGHGRSAPAIRDETTREGTGKGEELWLAAEEYDSGGAEEGTGEDSHQHNVRGENQSYDYGRLVDSQ